MDAQATAGAREGKARCPSSSTAWTHLVRTSARTLCHSFFQKRRRMCLFASRRLLVSRARPHAENAPSSCLKCFLLCTQAPWPAAAAPALAAALARSRVSLFPIWTVDSVLKCSNSGQPVLKTKFQRNFHILETQVRLPVRARLRRGAPRARATRDLDRAAHHALPTLHRGRALPPLRRSRTPQATLTTRDQRISLSLSLSGDLCWRQKRQERKSLVVFSPPDFGRKRTRKHPPSTAPTAARAQLRELRRKAGFENARDT